jgi:hypothetical protein
MECAVGFGELLLIDQLARCKQFFAGGFEGLDDVGTVFQGAEVFGSEDTLLPE